MRPLAMVSDSPRALAIGKFDALHLGHRALVERVAAYGPCALLGFSGMAEVLGWPSRLPLVAPSDRQRVLDDWRRGSGCGIDELVLPFTEVQPLSAERFLDLLVQRWAPAAVAVGADFRCGRGRATDAEEFASMASVRGMRVEIVAPVRDGESQAISSSRVRELLARGEVARARSCLGRPHRLVGTVERGDGRGRAIGVPTANCGMRENQEPAAGVYAAWALLDDQRFPAAVNVGNAPTVASGRALTVEAHLIGYRGECYGRRLGLDFAERIREERRFPGLPELRTQIGCDIDEARRLLA
jgi:riboflavin kinase / FMN adenylyltransferase